MEPKSSLECSQKPATGAILNQQNLVYTLIFYPFMMHFNIILSSTPRSPKWFLPFKFLRPRFLTHF
jgi:hypothetical protein